jgi:exodeoxyribonuclease VII large subunit
MDSQTCYTVSEITTLIRSLLENEFPRVTVEGEISNFRPSSTGHYYFTLKDQEAVLSIVMFKNRIKGLTFTPADGMLVKASGSISVYPKRGSYQLICERLIQSGKGDILALLEERKAKLAELGLFDAARKKTLPLLPKRIAVVTSPTGAAIRDILRVLKRRNSSVDLVVLPSPVQGDEAAPVIAEQIRIANTHKLGDVLIVGRGGGSLEDLLPFYDEAVVRAIADSEIPVISAVGHEIDITLADLAADVRAPTPSAAAELVAASREDLLRRVLEATSVIREAVTGRIDRIRLILDRFSPENLERNFRYLIQPCLLRFDEAGDQLKTAIENLLTGHRHRMEMSTGELRAHSPLDILKRGFAVVTHIPTGKIMLSSEQASIGDDVRIRLHKGSLLGEVKEEEKNEEL